MIQLQEIELFFGHTDRQTNGWTDGWTDRRGSRNSYLDLLGGSLFCSLASTLQIMHHLQGNIAHLSA